jgi:hypothetical protein
MGSSTFLSRFCQLPCLWMYRKQRNRLLFYIAGSVTEIKYSFSDNFGSKSMNQKNTSKWDILSIMVMLCPLMGYENNYNVSMFLRL